MQKQIFVLGLRRSGTTIFWKILREGTPFRSYNEPFNPLVNRLADPSWRSVATEYYQESLDLLDRLGAAYWHLFEPIYPAQELRPQFSADQEKYLSLLLESHDKVLIESTRCHFKVPTIAELASPKAVLVHLYRPPAEFATSHLVPSGKHPTRDEARVVYRSIAHEKISKAKSVARRMTDRASFWRRKHGYDEWSVESIVGRGTRSPFFELARERGLDAERINKMPAVGKVLAYWKLCYDRIEEDGAKYFGERFVSVNLERWADDPKPAINEILKLVGVEVNELDVSSVRRPSAAYQPTSPSWSNFFEALEIDNLSY